MRSPPSTATFVPAIHKSERAQARPMAICLLCVDPKSARTRLTVPQAMVESAMSGTVNSQVRRKSTLFLTPSPDYRAERNPEPLAKLDIGGGGGVSGGGSGFFGRASSRLRIISSFARSNFG